ncbi:DUF427 domain-containing protein [Streptacidiphilus sp. 4-A2]|nr:DUF427 domain-containing protein [Streptacidiphilus sp. 4-A2]
MASDNSQLQQPESVHQVGPVVLKPGQERVTVRSRGTVLADSRRTIAVHEGYHPVRYYFPPEDVRTELLSTASTASYCPYKGSAVHLTLEQEGSDDSVAWCYPEPLTGMEPLAGLIAFYQERTILQVEEEA